jgi:hypothetical protein
VTERDAVTELLQRARRRISDPGRWTQAFAARDEFWCPCGPAEDDARAWCAVGALRAEVADLGWPLTRIGQAYTRLHEAAGAAPEDVNDGRDHAAVLAMFDAAIRRK